METNVGDKVIVKNDKYFFNHVKNGDLGLVTDISDRQITVEINSKSLKFNVYYFTNNYFSKVDTIVRERYKDPEYIREIKRKLRAIEHVHGVQKQWYRFRDKIGSKKLSENYRESARELNYIYIILRQHNEMKKMYAKVRKVG